MRVERNLRYEKLRRIGVGEGQQSEVYLVRDLQTDRVIVAKEVPRDKFDDPDGYWRECRMMAQAAHSRVVRVIAGCESEDDNVVAILMQYIPGGSVATKIRDGSLSVRRAIELGLDLLHGLEQIHAARLLHLDVKPSNVLLDAQGRALVSDFGQATRIGPHGVGLQDQIYPWIRPPESYGPDRHTVHGDVYQAGVTMYRMLMPEAEYRKQADPLKDSWEARRDKAKAEKFPDRDRYLPHVPLKLRKVVNKAMRANPTMRYRSAAEFADALGLVAPKYDWTVEQYDEDVRRWSGSCANQAKIDVCCERLHGAWTINAFRIGGSRRRIRKYCTGSHTESALRRRLREIFNELG